MSWLLNMRLGFEGLCCDCLVCCVNRVYGVKYDLWWCFRGLVLRHWLYSITICLLSIVLLNLYNLQIHVICVHVVVGID